MKSISLKKFLASAAILCATGNVFAQWVWLDEHGVKQFSDTAPPPSVPEKRILKQPHGAAPGTAATSDAPPAAAAAGDASMSLAEKNADFNKRKQEKDKKAAEDKVKQEAKDKDCASAKSHLSVMQSGMRITNFDANGERHYLNDDERATQTQAAQDAVDKACN